MFETGHLPTVGEKIVIGQVCFEIVDRDGRRIDKVLAVVWGANADNVSEAH